MDEDTAEEVLKEVVSHIKMELTSQMTSFTLNIQIGPHSKIIQGKVSLRTWYAQSSWHLKVDAPPALSLMKRITRIV